MEMRPNRLRYCLENNIPTISTRIESPWAYMTELAAASGHFDFIEYEGEYAPHTEEELENVCRAAELYGCATVVKVDRQNRNFMAQKAIACGADAVMIGSPRAAAAEAPGKGYPGGTATFHPTLPRGARVHVGCLGSLKEILVGPAYENDGRRNLFGALRVAMATTGYSDVKEFQKAEVMIAPSIQTEGKALQRGQRVGMG